MKYNFEKELQKRVAERVSLISLIQEETNNIIVENEKEKKHKYPRTFHLPWSPGATADDRILTTTANFDNKQVIVTEKMDGENCTIGRHYTHARSTDSAHHPSRTWVKKLQGQIGFEIPDGWRLCGENLQAKHSIYYDNLPSYFLLFSVWDENNMCLSWSDTEEIAKMLNVKTVPVLYKGIWDPEKIESVFDGKSKMSKGGPSEGYVVRNAGSFSYNKFDQNIAKFVRESHVQTDAHWIQKEMVPNKLKLKKSFSESRKSNNIITEGGNVAAINRKTGEPIAYADKIDVSKIDRSKFVNEIKQALRNIDKVFKKEFGRNLWPDFSIVQNNDVFSGSSNFLFNLGISDEDFKKNKPFVGDIDITVPRENLQDLFDFLTKIEGKNVTQKVRYIGTNKSALGKKDQINTLFEYSLDENESMNIQIDFESAEYEKGKPTDWAKFSHSSNWEDVKEGLKGVAHKYLLKNVVRAVSYRPDIVILTSKSPLHPKDKIRVKKTTSIPKDLAFSVSKGLRRKIEQQFVNGKPVIIDGKYAFKEVPTSESKYVTDIELIFQMIFKKDPTKDDLNKFDSFIGLLDLMQKYLDNDTVELAVESMIESDLWGGQAQKLDRNSWEEDFKVKHAIIEKLFEKFPFLKSKFREDITMLASPCSNYYINYRETTGEHFDCSQKEAFVRTLKTFITEYVDYFFNKSRGLVERKQGEVYVRTKKRLKRGGKKIEFEETYIFPEEGGEAESLEEVQDMIKEKFGISKDKEIKEGIIGSNGVEINSIVNKPTSRSKAAMVVIFSDSKGKKIAFIKYFHNISAGGYGKWRDVDFFKETGYSRKEGSSRIEILPIKPSNLIGDENTRTYKQVLEQISDKAQKLVKKRAVPEFFIDHVEQLKQAINQGSSSPVLEDANPYRTVYAKYLGEILQPISVVTGWMLNGQYKEAQDMLIKKSFPNKGFSDMRIRYPMSAISNLIDSELVLEKEDLVIGVSSKSGVGGGASASVGSVYKSLKNDKKLAERISLSFPNAFKVIKGIKENNQFEGPLMVSLDLGLISKDEYDYVRKLFGKTGARGDMVSVDDFVEFVKGGNKPSSKLLKLSKLIGNESVIDVISSNDFSRNYKPGFHLLAGVAKGLSNYVNKNTKFNEMVRSILNNSSVVQVYTKTKKAGENGIVFEGFNLHFPPMFEGTIDLSSRKTYYTTGINGKMTFELKKV